MSISLEPALLLFGDGLRSLAGGMCGANKGLEGRAGGKIGAELPAASTDPGLGSGINRSSAPSATEPLRLWPSVGDIFGS